MIAQGRSRQFLALIAIFLLVGLWQIIGQSGHSLVPAPLAVLRQLITDWPLYRIHAAATLHRALPGFAIGAFTGFAAAALFCLAPRAEDVARETNIVILTMPAIVLSPLLALCFSGNTPQILLAALLSYFPCMAATLQGLRGIDPRWADVIASYGGSPLAVFAHVRMRACLTVALSGLAMAFPVAMTGAVLGEFGAGTDDGMGAFLLTALGQADSARLWGIGLVLSCLSLAGHAVFASLGRTLARSERPVTMAIDEEVFERAPGWTPHIARLISIGLPLVLWIGGLHVLRLNPIVAPGPLHVARALFFDPDAGDRRAAIAHALEQTLPLAGLGLIGGTGVACLLAAVEAMTPVVARIVFPAALLAQNMPVIALVPLIIGIAGRGQASAVTIAVLVTFFPAYVMISHGLRHAPRPALDLVEAYGGSAVRAFWLVRLPGARASVFTAMKLAMPQALLGVMVAEWLVTGTGLGNLMNEARGELDEDTVWACAALSMALSAAIYHLLDGVSARSTPGGTR